MHKILAASDEPTRHARRDRAVRIARTRVGLGVFAQRPYDAEELVGEIEGTIIDNWEYGSDYCMDMGDSRCLEPSAPFRFVNHSCEPNCQFQWYDIVREGRPEPERRIFLLALRRIASGQELTIDYNWPVHMAIPCRCGSIHCRGWVVAANELLQLIATLNAEPLCR